MAERGLSLRGRARRPTIQAMKRIALLLALAGCGTVEPSAPDDPGGPCESRDTVTGVGTVSGAVIDPADATKATVNGDLCSQIDFGVGDSETIDAKWSLRTVGTSSVSVGQASCYYYWTHTAQIDDCHWTVTVQLVKPKAAR